MLSDMLDEMENYLINEHILKTTYIVDLDYLIAFLGYNHKRLMSKEDIVKYLLDETDFNFLTFDWYKISERFFKRIFRGLPENLFCIVMGYFRIIVYPITPNNKQIAIDLLWRYFGEKHKQNKLSKITEFYRIDLSKNIKGLIEKYLFD